MRQREGQHLAEELLHRLSQLERAGQVISARAPNDWFGNGIGCGGRWRSCSTVGRWMNSGWRRKSRSRPTSWTLPRSWCGSRRTLRPAARPSPEDQPVGKQLGFLAQELGREVNTMGAKGNDAEILQQVIAMKGRVGEVPGAA